jgi:hypothetical protein
LDSRTAGGDLKPIFTVIDETTDPDTREQNWIAEFRAKGADLLNKNGGGHDNEHMLKAPTLPKSRGKHDEFRNTLFWLRDDIKLFTEIGKLKSVARMHRLLRSSKRRLKS